MKNIIDYLTTNIHLTLEDYYNKGLSSEQCKDIIENLKDPTSIINSKFRCIPSGINKNWKITVFTTNLNIDDLYEIEDIIIYELDKALKKLKTKSK